MSEKAESKFSSTRERIILIGIALATTLLFDGVLAGVVFAAESRETLALLFFLQAIIWIFVGIALALGGSDTIIDTTLESSRRGVPLRTDPVREGHTGKRLSSAEFMTYVLISLIGIIFIGLAVIVTYY